MSWAFLCLVWDYEGVKQNNEFRYRSIHCSIYMPRCRTIQIGRLGRFRFHQGVYFYAGAAQRNLSARLEHHNRKKKTLRWHVDYLSAGSEMLGAIIIAGSRELECQLANRLGGLFEPAMPGFGASDCGCIGHLFYTEELM